MFSSSNMLQFISQHKRRYLAIVTFCCLLGMTLALALRRNDATHDRADTSPALQHEEPVVGTHLGLVGSIEPAIESIVTAPFAGTILTLDVNEGQIVDRGHVLLTLDTADIDAHLRSALTDVLTARRALHELQSWESGPEMSRARRAVLSARQAFADTQQKLRDVRELFEIGIVPRMELDALAVQSRSQHIDIAVAEDDLKHVRARGSPDNLQIAEMALMNAVAKHEALLDAKRQRDVVAPFDGVVIRVRSNAPGDFVRPILPGAAVEQGQALLGLASLDRLQVSALVDEMDVALLSVGAPVEITGDAFDGLALQGVVSTVGIRGRGPAAVGSRARYTLTVDLLSIPEADRAKIRLNMSARLSIRISSDSTP